MKKFIAVILLALIFFACAVPAFSATDTSKLTFLYIDKGNIVIGDGTVSGYGYFGQRITLADEDGYYISQTSTQTVTNTITFSGGNNYVVINNLTMTMDNEFVCAVLLTNSAEVTLCVEGTNVIQSGASRAGIEVSADSTLNVVGNGRLAGRSVGRAGIGGCDGDSCGTIIINSGTIVGQSLNNSAGIGGGSSGSNGRIVINGGNVTGAGGTYGAGIGGGCTGSGGEIIINGGTVTAIGGTNAAGIGGGWYGSMGNIVINGGSVKATGGQNAPKIGAGTGASSDLILNSFGEVLYLAKVDTSSVPSLKDIYTDGNPNNLSSYHSNDKSFYFYLPAETHIFAVDSDESTTVYRRADYSSSFTCRAFSPFECINSATVQPDDIIRGLSCGLKNLNDYVVFAEGFSFDYSDSVLGTGTKANLVFNGAIVFSYTTLICGDLDGNGFYDGQDSFIASLMLWGHLTNENTEAYYFEAADVNKNSSVDGDDIKILQQAGLMLQAVPQNEDGTIDTDSVEWNEYILLVDQTQEDTGDFLSLIREFIDFVARYIKNLIQSLLII